MVLSESRQRRLRLRTTLAASALAWLLVAALQAGGILDPFDRHLLDWQFRLRGERRAPDTIAIVEVDDATIRAYGSWPLPRDAYAVLLAALAEAGARVVGVDLQFPEDPRQDPRANLLLAQMSDSLGNVVHSVWFQSYAAAGGASPRGPLDAALARRGVPADGARLARASTISLPVRPIAMGRSPLGHISVALDPDGAVRSLPMVVGYGGLAYPALSLVVAGRLLGAGPLESVRPAAGGFRVHWSGGRDRFIPADGSRLTRLDFAGDRRAFPARYSMLDVLGWFRDGEGGRLREAFHGRAVLVGLAAPAEVPDDLGATPFSANTPLVLVHANALENLMRGRFLSTVPTPLFLGLLALLSIGLGVACAGLPAPAAAAASAGLLIGYALADQAFLALLGVRLPMLAGLLAPGLVYAASTGSRHFLLERHAERREAEIREGFTVQQRFLPDALVGRRLSRYTIEEKIGSGGMGAVYRGRDVGSGRQVAIKVLLGGELTDEGQRRRFRREARLQSRFRHPGAAGFLEFDSQDGADFMVMEYVPGRPLAERLRRGPLPEREAVRVAMEIVEVLAAAHAQGIVHRDLKPANVMITPDGRARLLDFGVASLTGHNGTSTTLAQPLTATGEIVGTAAYLSPEQIRGEPAGPGVDLYGVGMLLFEMTTGRRPFPDDHPHELMHLVLNQPPPRPRVLNARLTAPLEALILRLLEKRSQDRYAGAAELLEALRSLP